MKMFGKRLLAFLAAAAVAVAFAGCDKSSSSSGEKSSSEKKSSSKKTKLQKDDPQSVLTYYLERKDMASLKKLVGENFSEDDLDKLIELFENWGLYDEGGKIRVKKVKLVYGEYAGISVFCDGKKAKEDGPYLVFCLAKKGDTWVLKYIAEDKSANGEHMKEVYIKRKCNRKR